MKYFGILDKDFFKENGENEFLDYLIKNNIYEIKRIAKGTTDNIQEGLLELMFNQNEALAVPVKDFVEEFYSYIINIFSHDIIKSKIEFFKFFNNEIYGLEFLEQKKIALLHFNDIYSDIQTGIITEFEEKKSENGINHIYLAGKFKMLYSQKNANKSNLIELVKINQYLMGNEESFLKENLLQKFEEIQDMIDFEIWLQILVELNDRFGFEEDRYFTERGREIQKFEKYNYIFKTLESYQFTNKKIKSFTEDHKAQIESLYQVLLEKNLIENHKENFMFFLKDEYNLSITKIINYKETINYKHNERVELFTQEWLNLTVKK